MRFLIIIVPYRRSLPRMDHRVDISAKEQEKFVRHLMTRIDRLVHIRLDPSYLSFLVVDVDHIE